MSPSDFVVLGLTGLGFLFGYFVGKKEGFKLAIIVMENMMPEESFAKMADNVRELNESE